jgi:hypothetical protein
MTVGKATACCSHTLREEIYTVLIFSRNLREEINTVHN